MQVLTEPKNALGKQYKKLFSMNNVSISVCDRVPHSVCMNVWGVKTWTHVATIANQTKFRQTKMPTSNWLKCDWFNDCSWQTILIMTHQMYLFNQLLSPSSYFFKTSKYSLISFFFSSFGVDCSLSQPFLPFYIGTWHGSLINCMISGPFVVGLCQVKLVNLFMPFAQIIQIVLCVHACACIHLFSLSFS